MNNSKFSRALALAFAPALFLLASCEKTGTGGSKTIQVTVSSDYITKSTDLTTNGLEKLGEFVLDAWLDDEYIDYVNDPGKTITDRHYINSGGAANVSYSAGKKWSLKTASNWIGSDQTRFWCYAPAGATGLSITSTDLCKKEKLDFTYSLPAPATGSSTGTDADNQEDLVFAYNTKTYIKGKSSEEVDLTFHHALSKINFMVSPDDGTFDTTLKIKQISIVGIASSGNCTFTGPNTLTDPQTTAFAWSGHGEKKTYRQNYEASFTSTPSGWSAGTYTNDTGTYSTLRCDNAFFVIPQTLTDAAKVRIIFDDNGRTTAELEADLHNIEWEADKYYTYKITATTIDRYINFGVTLQDWSDKDDKILIY